jgi:biopolymer transport protein ExbB/TolQ
MLIAAMGVGLERLITLQTARSQSRKIASQVGPLLGEGKLKDALGVCNDEAYSKSYLGHLLSAGLVEYSAREDAYGIEAVERAIEKNSIIETASLNKGLNILATVGSTAPFVGLVGTIFGIINAFGQIGAEGGADLTTLAPAIGEALITTAFGIIVAIAGVWLFNFFTAMIGDISNDMAESASELIDWCHKRVLPASKASK